MKAILFATTQRADIHIDIDLENTPREIVKAWYRKNPNYFREGFDDQLAIDDFLNGAENDNTWFALEVFDEDFESTSVYADWDEPLGKQADITAAISELDPEVEPIFAINIGENKVEDEFAEDVVFRVIQLLYRDGTEFMFSEEHEDGHLIVLPNRQAIHLQISKDGYSRLWWVSEVITDELIKEVLLTHWMSDDFAPDIGEVLLARDAKRGLHLHASYIIGDGLDSVDETASNIMMALLDFTSSVNKMARKYNIGCGHDPVSGHRHNPRGGGLCGHAVRGSAPAVLRLHQRRTGRAGRREAGRQM